MDGSRLGVDWQSVKPNGNAGWCYPLIHAAKAHKTESAEREVEIGPADQVGSRAGLEPCSDLGKTTCPSSGSPQVLMEEGIGPRRHGGHGEEMGT